VIFNPAHAIFHQNFYSANTVAFIVCYH